MVALPGTGWVPDTPDPRDKTAQTPEVKAQLARFGAPLLPQSIDLRNTVPFPPIDSQGNAQSCTAHAAASLVEYFETAAFKSYASPSRLFIYKATRNLLQQTADSGALLRTTMQALTLFGAPPEVYWPYDLNNLNVEPTPFCYSFAQNFKATLYYRYDGANAAKADVLQQIKTNLAAKLPAMFGFYIFNSMTQAGQNGFIPFPDTGESAVGAHAVAAIGYDDTLKIRNSNSGNETTGAFLIRNSWGAGWGLGGYGWLPYQFVLSDLAVDWWSLLKAEWIDSGQFGFARPV